MGGGIVMKQFSLEEYIKNPSRKIVTRDGKPVKILCTNLVSDKPVTAQIDGTGYSLSYTKDGKCSLCQNSIDDLFFKPEKHEGWINLYRNEDGISWISPNYFTSKKEAEKEGKSYTCSVTTIKIEWEE